MTLSATEIESFERDGYLVVADAVGGDVLGEIRCDFQRWVEQSRAESAAYGNTINGKPRFDLADGHSAEAPKLRRVNAPVEISGACMAAMKDSRIPDMVADLIGPGIRFHHSKINSKLPGSDTAVKWHQDFPFTPHTNDDLVTALLMIDDVTGDNGPLRVLPGSHLGPLHSLWHDDRFTGSIDEHVANQCEGEALNCVGKAGSVCLMHTRLLHGSQPNRSKAPRTLLINVYSAEDAIPCSPNPMPNKFEGELIRGEFSGRVRMVENQLRLPELPDTASFFDQQESN